MNLVFTTTASRANRGTCVRLKYSRTSAWPDFQGSIQEQSRGVRRFVSSNSNWRNRPTNTWRPMRVTTIDLSEGGMAVRGGLGTWHTRALER